MRIGEVSKPTGSDVQTVRFCVREGLLRMPPRESDRARACGILAELLQAVDGVG